MKKSITLLATTMFFTAMTSAQSVAINTDGSTAATTALLDVKSTAKGILIPRMSKSEKNAIGSPATGLLVFQDTPDSIGFYYYGGSKWLWLATADNTDTNRIIQLAYKITKQFQSMRVMREISQHGEIPEMEKIQTTRGQVLGWNKSLQTGSDILDRYIPE